MITAALFDVVPIDDAARDGRFQLVVHGGRFALVRFAAGRWTFSSGMPFPGRPSHYKPRKD